MNTEDSMKGTKDIVREVRKYFGTGNLKSADALNRRAVDLAFRWLYCVDNEYEDQDEEKDNQPIPKLICIFYLNILSPVHVL